MEFNGQVWAAGEVKRAWGLSEPMMSELVGKAVEEVGRYQERQRRLVEHRAETEKKLRCVDREFHKALPVVPLLFLHERQRQKVHQLFRVVSDRLDHAFRQRIRSLVSHFEALAARDASSYFLHSSSSRLILSRWYQAHRDFPYPSPQEKRALAKQCAMSIKQIDYWFGNRRARDRRRSSSSSDSSSPSSH